MITLKAPFHNAIEVPTDVALIRRYMNAHGYDASDEDIQYVYRVWCRLNHVEWLHIWRYRYLGSLHNQLPRAASNVIFIMMGGDFECRTFGVYTMVLNGQDITPDEFDKIWKKDVDRDDDWRYNLDMANDIQIKTKEF